MSATAGETWTRRTVYPLKIITMKPKKPTRKQPWQKSVMRNLTLLTRVHTLCIHLISLKLFQISWVTAVVELTKRPHLHVLLLPGPGSSPVECILIFILVQYCTYSQTVTVSDERTCLNRIYV